MTKIVIYRKISLFFATEFTFIGIKSGRYVALVSTGRKWLHVPLAEHHCIEEKKIQLIIQIRRFFVREFRLFLFVGERSHASTASEANGVRNFSYRVKEFQSNFLIYNIFLRYQQVLQVGLVVLMTVKITINESNNQIII